MSRPIQHSSIIVIKRQMWLLETSSDWFAPNYRSTYTPTSTSTSCTTDLTTPHTKTRNWTRQSCRSNISVSTHNRIPRLYHGFLQLANCLGGKLELLYSKGDSCRKSIRRVIILDDEYYWSKNKTVEKSPSLNW